MAICYNITWVISGQFYIDSSQFESKLKAILNNKSHIRYK